VNPQNGYGDVNDHAAGGTRTSAHRHAYHLTHGGPSELSVLHKCDTSTNAIRGFAAIPRIFGSEQLWTNWIDSVNKGRQPIVLPGERNGSAKLTADEVRAIRRSAARVADLVRQYWVNDLKVE
jgi:hypothetical protein